MVENIQCLIGMSVGELLIVVLRSIFILKFHCVLGLFRNAIVFALCACY